MILERFLLLIFACLPKTPCFLWSFFLSSSSSFSLEPCNFVYLWDTKTGREKKWEKLSWMPSCLLFLSFFLSPYSTVQYEPVFLLQSNPHMQSPALLFCSVFPLYSGSWNTNTVLHIVLLLYENIAIISC